jgi:NADH-quinone oxidoreductase subunit A
MVTCSQIPAAFYHFAAYALTALLLLSLLLMAAKWLGSGRSSKNKSMPFESGIMPESSSRLAWPVPFYLIAIFFIIFDVEAAFIFTWAVAWDLLGIPGMVQITVFILILLAGLIWLWLKGALDWGPAQKNRP